MTIVEKIHSAVDNAQDRILKQSKEYINSISEKDINKAERLINIGFINTPDVKKTQLENIKLNKYKIEYLEYLIKKYPFHKFITIDDFNNICKKYKLIYSSVQNYIKEIPDKNLFEIENGKKLDSVDCRGIGYRIDIVDDLSIANTFFKNFNLNPDFITINDVEKLHLMYQSHAPKEWNFNGTSKNMIFYDAMKSTNLEFNITKFTELNYNGYFIAAPKSHFNLTGLTKNKFGYFLIKQFEIKDPIVFQYCKNDFIRIETKWGIEANDNELVLPINN